MREDEQVAQERARAKPKRRRRHSRAQAIVEFALVAPLFFTLLFGVVEFSLIHTAIDIVNFATKDAARLGSLLGRTDATVDTQMVTEIRSRVTGIVIAKVTKIEVFKSDAAGNVVLVGGNPVEYVYNVSGGNIGTTNWPVNQRNDTQLNADYLGVKVTYNYTYLTGFIAGAGSTLQLTATSVQRIEPQDYQGNYVAPHSTIGAGTIALASTTNSVAMLSNVTNALPVWTRREMSEVAL